MSSLSRLTRFSVTDERARTTLQMLSQTVVAGVMWPVLWYVVAPLLGVRILDLGEFAQSLLSAMLPITLSGVEPSQSLIEIVAGFLFWTYPIIVALCAILTISTALWYVVGRFIEPLVVPDAGGEA